MIELHCDSPKEIFQFGGYLCIPTNGSLKKDSSLVMGKGFALQVAKLFPSIPQHLGNLISIYGNHVIHIGTVSNKHCCYNFISFPTKHLWYEKSSLSLIERSAKELVVVTHYLSSIYLPRPGCGNGGLDYTEVKPVLESILFDNKFAVVDL